MATERVAHWAVNLSYSSLPPEVVQSAVQAFYNWAGCALGGSAHPTTTRAHDALAPFFGQPTSTLFGRKGARTDASHAALINGIASHVHDYDDTHLETIIHPTGPVASALFAQSEALGSVTGEDFILALVTGIEAECKLGLGVWPEHYDIGWHITSTVGSIGAAVAVGKLMKLQKEPMQHAISIAATQVTGLREMFGTDTKSSIVSNDVDVQVASLGTVWEIAKNAFKPFPCGIVVHPVIDGCIQLHRDMTAKGMSAADIQSVHARVHPLVLELTGKKTPKDGLQAKFSVYHGGSVGLVLGKAGPAQYEDKVVLDDEIVALRDRITATADESLGADETEITLILRDGTTMTKHVQHAIGSLEKFVDQVSLVLGAEGARQASQTCWALQGINSVTELAKNIELLSNCTQI
ncbi:MmgE/PrpD family protein [Mycena sp. CBHHK59/15]|nr:MmgE/PrpD family protein [Mycena sp. CBHHK59/15]